MDELKLTGNCLLGSRPILSFDHVSYFVCLYNSVELKIRILRATARFLFFLMSHFRGTQPQISAPTFLHSIKKTLSTCFLDCWKNVHEYKVCPTVDITAAALSRHTSAVFI